MKSEWGAVHEVAQRLAGAGRASVRLTDLAVACTVASTRKLLPGRTSLTEGEALRDGVAQIALAPLPCLDEQESLWTLLARTADKAGRAAEQEGAIDEWVAASQAADPGRKTRGAYATPMPLARVLAAHTLKPFEGKGQAVRVVDPSAGAGALLVAALGVLGRGADPDHLLAVTYNLYGVEIDPAARELCCLLLWIAGARGNPSLARIAENIRLDNAITRDWWDGSEAPFDALVMNPPWESLRHAVSDADPQAKARAATVERLEQLDWGSPGLPALYSAQGTGDRNLFKAFVELAPHLLAEGGRLGALIPAAFASDLGMAPLRQRYLSYLSLERWTSYENLRRLFPIDGRYKYGILIGQRTNTGTKSFAIRSFATEPEHIDAPHIIVTRADLERLGGAGCMFPELVSQAEAEILSSAFAHGTPCFKPGALGRVQYQREVDLTLDRGLFTRFEDRPDVAPTGTGTYLAPDGSKLAPLVEGRMVGQYDFFQKSWISGSGRTAEWVLNTGRPLEQCRPQYLAPVSKHASSRIAICDVTSATNTRTILAAWVPPSWPCGNTAPVLVFENETLALAGLAVLNSMVFDWLARRVISGLHVNKFYLQALVWPRLAPKSVKTIADAAHFLSAQEPRFAAVGGFPLPEPSSVAGLDYEAAHTLIEREVARGYGLTGTMLETMFHPDRTDRRGFWRYFAANQQAAAIVKQIMATRGLACRCAPLPCECDCLPGVPNPV